MILRHRCTEFSYIQQEIADTAEDYRGYDYIGLGLFRTRYSLAAGMAEAINGSWGVFEAWMPFSGSVVPGTTNREGQPLEPLQDDYYKISFEEYMNFQGLKPSGYIFHSWTMPSSPVRGRPAEQVLKDYFSKI